MYKLVNLHASNQLSSLIKCGLNISTFTREVNRKGSPYIFVFIYNNCWLVNVRSALNKRRDRKVGCERVSFLLLWLN